MHGSVFAFGQSQPGPICYRERGHAKIEKSVNAGEAFWAFSQESRRRSPPPLPERRHAYKWDPPLLKNTLQYHTQKNCAFDGVSAPISPAPPRGIRAKPWIKLILTYNIV